MEQTKSIPLEILNQFAIDGAMISIEELKRGHINRTYLATWGKGRQRRRYVHQVVNHRIFQDIDGLMRNLDIVTSTLQAKKESGELRADEKTLTLIKAKSGANYLQDEGGEYWRTFEYIENTTTFDVCPNSNVARESAAILGRFQRALIDLDARQFAETIPYFVDGHRRYEVFSEAVKSDAFKRVTTCREEIEFAAERADFGGSLIRAVREGVVPARLSHNDMKLNNVLFSRDGARAVCLLDLDTCMSGTVLYDFGDLVRNTAVPCAEDEQDLSKVVFDMELYRAICEGYLSEMGRALSGPERELLALAPRNLALILGVRFLTDYLCGDTYFRIHRKAQNLERSRTQFQIVRLMERLEDQMREVAQDR
jgi:Ser/Thr protein kinase RdoA (MazF antagonist)